jgi:L-lactate permease
MVQLIRAGGPGSPAFIIGYYLSRALSRGFLAISGCLGALGSFFSGSTTVSNLTFGDIQKIAAEEVGVPVTGMLAVQVVGEYSGRLGGGEDGIVDQAGGPVGLLIWLCS